MGPTLLFGIGMSAAWSFVRYRVPAISPSLADAGIAAGLTLMALSLIPGVRLPVIVLGVVGAACLIGAISLQFAAMGAAPSNAIVPEPALPAKPPGEAAGYSKEPQDHSKSASFKITPHEGPPGTPAKQETDLSPAPPATLRQLTQLYISSHDGISSEMMAGLELPRADWLNEQLENRGANWRVRSVRGPNAELYAVPASSLQSLGEDPPIPPDGPPRPVEISPEQARILTRGFFQMRQELAAIWVDRPMSGPTPQAWLTLMEAFNRAGIEAVSDLQNPSHLDQAGIVICVPDPKHPSESAQRLRTLFAQAKIATTFDVISDRQRLRKDDAPNLVIYVAPAPL